MISTARVSLWNRSLEHSLQVPRPHFISNLLLIMQSYTIVYHMVAITNELHDFVIQ